MCERPKMSVRPKVLYKTQKSGKARNVDCLRKPARREQSQAKTEAEEATATKVP